jgi:hypothetical protein
VRFERVAEKNNKTTLRAINLGTGKQDNAGGYNTTSIGSMVQGRNETLDHIKDKKEEIPVTPTVTPSHTTSGNDKGAAKDQGKRG